MLMTFEITLKFLHLADLLHPILKFKGHAGGVSNRYKKDRFRLLFNELNHLAFNPRRKENWHLNGLYYDSYSTRTRQPS